ncbi:MAG: DUF2726 domain-containing protein [Christensenellaceae bacterium]|jgi:cbb3-type cytochrome oxidase subunit 3|nr:DUF2726 domain-containing protein [Christensenellaceae bacterium]
MKDLFLAKEGSDIFLGVVIPIAVIVLLLCGLGIWLSAYSKKRAADAEENFRRSNIALLPKSADIVPYLNDNSKKFFDVLKRALPAQFIIYPNVCVEKLFEYRSRDMLQMQDAYADFVIFNEALMPMLVIDLFDTSLVSLEGINRLKNRYKTIIKNSGVPVLDYEIKEVYNLDELRREMAAAINPIRTAGRQD